MRSRRRTRSTRRVSRRRPSRSRVTTDSSTTVSRCSRSTASRTTRNNRQGLPPSQRATMNSRRLNVSLRWRRWRNPLLARHRTMHGGHPVWLGTESAANILSLPAQTRDTDPTPPLTTSRTGRVSPRPARRLRPRPPRRRTTRRPRDRRRLPRRSKAGDLRCPFERSTPNWADLPASS